MAGIFGMGNQGGMGILGAAQQTQPWQSTLGILASALKDATNSFSGNGGDTDNLSKWNATQGQNQIRQQLIAGLTSEDPAIRQQAYGIAPLFGVDPSAFQKQRAAQAFPQLLTAMQPQQVTAPAAQADAGEFGKINVPASNLGMAPGMNFGEALSIVNSPELTAQYAPDLVKSRITAEADAAKPFDLSPGQHRFVNGQDVASLPEKPNFNQPFNVDGTPNLAYQKYTKDLKAFEQAPAWAGIAIQKQRLENAAKGLIDPDTIGFMADQVLTGDKSPFQNLGRGQQGADNIAALRKEVMTRAKARGLGGSDLASLNAEFSGLQAGERTLGTRTANVEMAASEAQNLIPLALAASEKVNRSQFPALNSIIMAGEKGVGDENVVRLGVATNGLINTYARAISPTGNPTVSDKDHAREILSQAWSKGQFRAGVDQMQQEIAAARKSPGSVRGEFRSAISGRAPGVAAVPDALGTGALPRIPSAAPSNQGWGNFRVHP